MSGTWCWRWSREKPLTLSIHTMDNSLGPIIGNFPVSLTASPTRPDSIYTIHHHAQESRWILVSTGQEHALTNSRISCSQGALLNSELSASACCGSNHQDVTSSWGAFIRFLRGMSTTERINELHTERGRAWREAWWSCRLWCWFIIFLCRANKLKKQAWWCFHPCRALTKPSDFILVVGARISTGLNTVHASLARWFKPVYIFAMLADRSERFF